MLTWTVDEVRMVAWKAALGSLTCLSKSTGDIS